jgi:hypothetical protein
MLIAILLYPFIRYIVLWFERYYDIYNYRRGPRKHHEYLLYLQCLDDYKNPFRRLERKENKGKKRKVWRNISILSIIIFILIYLPAAIWPAEPPQVEPPQVQVQVRSLENITGMTLSHCFSPEQQYCYYEKQWLGPVDRQTWQPNYFIDEYEDIYFVKQGQKRDDNQHVVVGDNLIKETHLVRTLTRLREKEGERCICPSFLGIYDNMSFIYYHDTTEWIIMNEPVIGEATPGARLINTMVKYPENSAFKQFIPATMTKSEHWDSFSVSFNSPSFQFDSNDVKPLASLNHKLLQYDTIEMKRTEQSQFILRRLDREREMRRISIKLKGDEAMCFIFCQRLASLL